MNRFAELFRTLDTTNSQNEKVAALVMYFRDSPPAAAAWGLYFLMGLKLKRLLGTRQVAKWVQEDLGIPAWLFRECYGSVGDGAETIALLLDSMPLPDAARVAHREMSSRSSLLLHPGNVPTEAVVDRPSHMQGADRPNISPRHVTLNVWVEERLLTLRQMEPSEQRSAVLGWLSELDRTERFLLLKMLSGEMRIGVSRGVVLAALAQLAGLPTAILAHRLSGSWQPDEGLLGRLVAPVDVSDTQDISSRPYPFYLATPLHEHSGQTVERAEDPTVLGDVGDYLIEWKWDGIRAQVIKRGGNVSIWSRGDELLTQRFPEVLDAASRLPDGTVLDGELLCWRNGLPLGFAAMQTRIGRTHLPRTLLTKNPAVFVAYDLLEFSGGDLRPHSMAARRDGLERILATIPKIAQNKLLLSERINVTSWAKARDARATSRQRGVEGLMLKLLESPYSSGRVRGAWWKWKIDPLTFDGVLIYAEPGHGRRANLLTDYTFAVWDGATSGSGTLVPVARAYSGLTDKEIAELDSWLRSNTVGRFGPVRHVKPFRVFELAFEGIAESTRHRGGVAMRFPRIVRERSDKRAEEADTLAQLRSLLHVTGASNSSAQQMLFE